MDIRFCFVVPAQLSNPLRVLSKTQPGWIMNIPAVGLIGSPPIILAMNYWPLVIGYWLLAWLCGFADICASTLYALRFTLKATATTPLTFRLIASSHHHLYALISLPARGSVLTQMPQADAGAVRSSAGQNRWSVRQNIKSSTKGR